jgi:serine/threonine-protein kinase
VVQTVQLPVEPSRPIGDLAQEKLIRDASRARVNGIIVPSLGGVPLLCKLGQGGMGAVYYGIQPSTGREVAVKVLPFHLAERNPEMLQRFHREAKLAAAIESPNLVKIFDVSEENGLVFMIMEYVNGSSAGAYIKALRSEGLVLRERPALELCLATARGLAAAHAQGVIHRDIKPDNILIPWDPAGHRPRLDETKLADLGLARNIEAHGESLTASSAALGTPGYMAPEQGLDAKNAGRPSDVFSLGATLYAVLCGRAPFRSTSVMLTLLDTAQRPHHPVCEIRKDISERSAGLIDRCLSKDPAQRFPDAGALIAALEECLNALPESTELTLKLDLPEIEPASSTQPVVGHAHLYGRSAVPSAPPVLVPVKRSRAWWAVLLSVAMVFLLLGVFAFKPEEKTDPKPVRIASQSLPAADAAQPPDSGAVQVPVDERPAPAQPPSAAAPAPDGVAFRARELAEKAAQEDGLRQAQRQAEAFAGERELAAKTGMTDKTLALKTSDLRTDGGDFAELLDAAKAEPPPKVAAAPPPRNAGIQAAKSAYDGALAEGRTALLAEQWEIAGKAFQKALARRPDDEDATRGLRLAVEGLQRERKFREFIALAQQALRDGNLAKAEEQLKAAQELKPASSEIQTALQRLQDERRKQPQDAKQAEREQP